jgi:hypothetical protein
MKAVRNYRPLAVGIEASPVMPTAVMMAITSVAIVVDDTAVISGPTRSRRWLHRAVE